MLRLTRAGIETQLDDDPMQQMTSSENKNNVNINKTMAKHTHDFVETYDGIVGFGMDREHDEKAVIYYLQKFSDDTMMAEIIKRMSDEELEEIFDMINRIMKHHFTEPEYHRLFLKEEDHHE